MINPATGNRIKMKTVDAGTGEDVSRGDLGACLNMVAYFEEI
jgi:non-homologous end joining protein Ku